MTTTLAILLSQDGYPLQAIIDAIRANYLEAEIVVVITNQAEAAWTPHAQKARIPIVEHQLATYQASGRDRQAYDADLAALVQKYQPDWVILAGWTHVLSTAFLQHFPYRVVNLHLGPPGKFTGAHAIRDARAAFERGEIKQTGVTAHFVPDERVNRGTTLDTQDVPIYRSDTLAMLTQRIQRAGSTLLVNALRRLIQGDDD